MIANLFLTGLLLTNLQWVLQQSGTSVRLRGVSAVDDQVVWTSGSESTVLRSTDGGDTWHRIRVTDEELDFRDIDAIDASRAYVLSIGNGSASRIYKTLDGGKTWQLQFKTNNEKVFLDAMSFWDADHGLAFGDSVDGLFYLLITENGGKLWRRIPPNVLPKALPGEGAFAASGTNIAMFGERHAWIGTGAREKARVLRTTDAGRTWTISETPLRAGPSAGIFSVAFRDAKNGVVVGGDYRKESEALDNLAVTNDGGMTWKLVRGLTGYRSVVAFVPQSNIVVAIGPSGADYSQDGGVTWNPLRDSPGFDTLSFARVTEGNSKYSQSVRKKPGEIAWGAGVNGRIGRLTVTR